MYSIRSFYKNSSLFEDFINVPKMIYEGDPVKKDFTSSLADIKAHKLFAIYEGDRAIGRIAALFNPEITKGGRKTGLVGYYECINSVEASNMLLNSAIEYLKNLGCECCLGPMNGNTWQNYRLTLPDEAPPFFLDNYHKSYYHKLFQEYGFKEDARYISSKIPRKHFAFKRIDSFSHRLKKNGITVRKFELKEFNEDLQNIYTICLEGFADNLYYTPIEWKEFESIYLPIKTVLNEQLLLLAIGSEGKPLGFVFALPNLLSTQVKSLVIKTVAVIPEARSQGLGSYLVELVHKAAYDMGFEEIIHPLMHSDNISTRIGASGSGIFRNYVLMKIEI